jgi:adenine-specific DNA methylase
MKYMGSKRAMLANGLGEAIADALPKHRRFVDLFTGSGAVAWHVARNYDVEVRAGDLQQFSVVLAASVIGRTSPLTGATLSKWLIAADDRARATPVFLKAEKLQMTIGDRGIASIAKQARDLCSAKTSPVVTAYGGYYFSPMQAIYLDALRETLPKSGIKRDVGLASLIWAASRCAASPGHTAQPFKANATAGRFLREAWMRDIKTFVSDAHRTIAHVYSHQKGVAECVDASLLAAKLGEGDLAFLDPPYSGVHYSRFYHVLETLTANEHFEVSGSGRYPPRDNRPQSDFSVQTRSRSALHSLLETLSRTGCSAIITFPAGEASNGLTGKAVKELARSYFKIRSEKVTSRFSTLGGNLRNRDARQSSEELILTLTPKAA